MHDLPAPRDVPARPGGGARAPVAIGVAVVNWNGREDTASCLASLVAASPGPARVVVVDNGSADGSVEYLARWAAAHDVAHVVRGAGTPAADAAGAEAGAWLTIVDAAANLGFAGGSNVGLALLRQDRTLTHFLLLNNDATVAPDYFGEIAAALREAPDAGLLTGTIYTAGPEPRVWYAGGVAKPLRALMLHAYAVPAAANPVETPFVCGCSMVLSRAVLRALGPLAECYFPGYWEDAEYSTRARAQGFSLLYAPRAAVYHKVGATFGSPWVTPRTAYAQNRHRVFYVRRNMRGWTRAAALAYLAVTKPGRAVLEALRGKPRVGLAIARGTAAGFFSRAAREGAAGGGPGSARPARR